MDYMEMLQKIFEVCVIPLLGILTTYLVIFIKQKSRELQGTTDNELYKKYIGLLQDKVLMSTERSLTENHICPIFVQFLVIFVAKKVHQHCINVQ